MKKTIELKGISELYTKVLEDAFGFKNDSDKQTEKYKLYHTALASVIVSEKALSIEVLEIILNVVDDAGDRLSLIPTFKKLQSFLLINNKKVDSQAIPRFHNNMSFSQAEQQERFSAWLFIKSRLTKSKALSHKQCISLWYTLCITAEDEIEYVIKLCFLERELWNESLVRKIYPNNFLCWANL